MMKLTHESLSKLFTLVSYQTVTLLLCLRDLRMFHTLSILNAWKTANVQIMGRSSKNIKLNNFQYHIIIDLKHLKRCGFMHSNAICIKAIYSQCKTNRRSLIYNNNWQNNNSICKIHYQILYLQTKLECYICLAT